MKNCKGDGHGHTCLKPTCKDCFPRARYRPILPIHQTAYDECAEQARGVFIENFLVPAVNCHSLHSGEQAYSLLKMFPDAPFVVTYHVNGYGDKEWILSAWDHGVDVCEMAKHLPEGEVIYKDGAIRAARFITKSHYQWPSFVYEKTYKDYLLEQAETNKRFNRK